MSQHTFPGQYLAPVAKPHGNMAVTSLVLGIIGLVFGLIPLTCWIAIPCGLLAVVFGAFGRKYGKAKAGLVMGVIALALGIWGAVIVGTAVNDLNDNLQDINNSASSYNDCINAATTVAQMDAC